MHSLLATAEPVDAPDWLILLIPVIVLCGGALLWCSACWISSRIYGWANLARHYRATGAPSGAASTRYASTRSWGQPMALDFHVTERGLFIGMMPVFALGHPRLFVPWGEFHGPRPAFGLLLKKVALSIGRPVRGVLVIPKDFHEQSLEKHLPT